MTKIESGKQKVEDFTSDLDEGKGLIMVKIDLTTGTGSFLFLNDIPTQTIEGVGQTLINFAQEITKKKKRKEDIEPLMN